MAHALDFRRLRYTPLGDLVRGQLTGRLDWRERVTAAALPAPAEALILRVLKRTRLWRGERVAVADELIAHFADGIASGESASELVDRFGDERAAAKLIRRAKRRGRPLLWHAGKYVVRGFLVVVAAYCVEFIRFVARTPSITVDYLAMLNVEAVRFAPNGRAWPIYRQALVALDLNHDTAFNRPLKITPTVDGRKLRDATVDDVEWPELVAWVDAHAAQIELVRQAASKPGMGFVLGDHGDADDPALDFLETPRSAQAWSMTAHRRVAPRPLIEQSTVSLATPHLNHWTNLADLIVADSRVAKSKHDGARLTADLFALRGMARQFRGPFLVEQFISLTMDRILCNRIAEVLRESPELLDDAALVGLAHALSGVGGETASTVIDLTGERLTQRDLLQRMYTDDGHGDGYLTTEGATILRGFNSYEFDGRGNRPDIRQLLISNAISVTKTRAVVLAEFDRLMAVTESQFARPLYEVMDETKWANGQIEDRLIEIRYSPMLYAKLFPVLTLMPTVSYAQHSAELVLGMRDGIIVAIAAELYHRRHGGYPASIESFVPEFLPRVPMDRFDRFALRYRVIDGRPVVYSVGIDRDDDAGRACRNRGSGDIEPLMAAQWLPARECTPAILAKYDGDWVIYDGRAKAPTTQPD